jgi:hypothetical protein
MADLWLGVTLLVAGLVGLVVMSRRHGSPLRAIERSYLPTYLSVFAAGWGACAVARGLFGWSGLVLGLAVAGVALIGLIVANRDRIRSSRGTR